METRTNDAHLAALDAERAAIDRYRELEEWFDERGLADLASLCAGLSGRHQRIRARLAGSDMSAAPENERASAPWVRGKVGERAREFLYRVASPRDLLEMALAAESDGQCVSQLEAAIRLLGPVDWEASIESGTGPGLALGADRRIRARRGAAARG